MNPIRAEKCYIKECFQPQAYTICLKGTIVFHLSSRQMKMSKNVCVCLRPSAAKYPSTGISQLVSVSQWLI